MSELNPVRIAVIGAGAMGRNHIRFVTEEPEAELIAIADAFEGARATAEAAGVPSKHKKTAAGELQEDSIMEFEEVINERTEN